MKAGFHSMYLADRPLTEAIPRVAEAGYEAIELNAERLPWAEPHIGPLAPDVDPDEVAQAAREAGLEVSAVGAHIEMLSCNPDEALAHVRACVDVATTVGAPVVHVLSGVQPADMGDDEAFRRSVEHARAVVDVAGEAGVQAAWEAVVGMSVSRAQDLERLMDEVDGLRVNYDPSHLQLTDGDAVASARRLAPRTVHVHVKDAAGRFPDHEFPPLGLGAIDLQGTIEALREGGYGGVASVEWEAHGVGGYPREDAVALEGSRRFMREQLGI